MRLSGNSPEKTPVDSHGNRPRNSVEKCAPIAWTVGSSDQGHGLGATPLDGTSEDQLQPVSFILEWLLHLPPPLARQQPHLVFKVFEVGRQPERDVGVR